MLCETVLKLRSEAELESLLEVLILPSCDPRRSADVPSTSVYFGVNEALKIAVENGTEMPAQNSVRQLQKPPHKVAVSENGNMAGGDNLLASQKVAAETAIHKKGCISQETRPDASSLKWSRKRRAEAGDASYAAESAAAAAAASRERSRTIGGMEHRSKRPVAKVHIPRKRKRKVYDKLPGYGDSFPFMNYLVSDELQFSYRLSELSYFAILDKDPDDPMMLISLCEIDDLTTVQQQSFIRGLNGAFIGRKLRFTSVHSPYRDRSSSRLGQLSFQTYCDGHFMECGSVNHVHMLCLHQWALKEPLEKVVWNTWREDSQSAAASLPYPSVGSFVSDACSWLSSQLCYLMSEMGIDCTDPPDIFIGSSLPSERITNGLYRMFCRYVDYLCEKSDAYFQDVDYYRSVAHASEQNGRAGETETYADTATCGDRRAKRSKLTLTSYSARKKDLSKQSTMRSSGWQRSAEYDRDDMFFELDESGLFEGADLEHEMARFNGDHSDHHRTDYASAAHRKRKLPTDYDDHGHERYQKARRVHGDHARLVAGDRESDGDVHRKRSDKWRVGWQDADADVSARDNLTSPSRYEDSPDFMLYDEDGNIVVNCADTGHAIVDEVVCGESVRRDDQLKSAVDAEPSGLSVVDEWYESNSQLYGVIHDHCYTSSSQCSMETAAPVVSDLGVENRLSAVDVQNSDGDNSALHLMPVELADAAENSDAKNNNLVDGRKSQLSSDIAAGRTAGRIHPLSSLSVLSGAAVSGANANSAGCEASPKNSAMQMHLLSAVNAAAGRKANAESVTKSPKQPVTKKLVKLISPRQAAQKEGLMYAQKRRDLENVFEIFEKPVRHKKPVSPRQAAQKEGLMGGQKRRNVCEDVTEKLVRHKKPISPQQTAWKQSFVDVQKKHNVVANAAEKPVRYKKPLTPQQTARKESLVDSAEERDVGQDLSEKSVRRKKPQQTERSADVQRSRDSKDKPSKTPRKTSNAPRVSRQKDSASVSASKEIGSSSSSEKGSSVVSSKRCDVSTDTNKVSRKKVGVLLDNTEKVSSEVTEVSAKPVEREQTMSVEPDNSASESRPSAAAVASAARAASHYHDAYMSETADAYGVLPSSNFDVAFDPTEVPGGHMYNPFRKTWPYLQHVIDGKTDLLMKVCSFPDVKSFSIRRVMRENGFLWAVCLALFDPEADLIAESKVKGAKPPNNALMAAFRQAVEAKKKVAAAKSKSVVVKHNSDDAAWSAKRPAGKVSIVFGSAVKSGGSLSSVVSADQPAKTESTAEKLGNLLTSAISRINSGMSVMISRKCGEQCVDKGAQAATECSLPAASKHLNVLSDLAVAMYDIAECKLEEIFAAEEADRMENEKDTESAGVVSTASAVTSTAVVSAACQPHVSASSSASGVISSSASLPPVNTSEGSTAEMTPVSGPASAEVRMTSAAGQVSQPSISQSVSVTAACTSAATDTVVSVSAAVPVALPVTATVTATRVADMPPPPLPPLSCIGVGFDLRVSAVGTSSGSEVSPSKPLSASLASVSQKPLTCTAAYQGSLYPPPISTKPTSSVLASFSNSTLPSEQLMHMPPPPAIQPNLYSVPPAVGVALNVPLSSFPDTSLPPPPVPACPPPPSPWYLSSSSSSSSLPAPVTNAANATSSISRPCPVPPRPDALNSSQRPVSTGAQLSQASGSTPATATLIPAIQPPPLPAFSSVLVSPATFKSALSQLYRGNRPFGPLKPVIPETQQSTGPRLSGPVVRQVRPVSSATPTQSIPGGSPQLSSNVATSIGSSLTGQVPPVRPGPSVSQLSLSASSGSQPAGTGAPVGQSPRSAVPPRPAPPIGASSGNQFPPIQPNQPTATSSVRSPWTGFRPRIAGLATSVSQPTVGSGAPRGPVVHAASKLPSNPAGPAGAVVPHPSLPLTTTGGVQAVPLGQGPWLTHSSRVYVLNSDSSPLCKDVEVSLPFASRIFAILCL